MDSSIAKFTDQLHKKFQEILTKEYGYDPWDLRGLLGAEDWSPVRVLREQFMARGDSTEIRYNQMLSSYPHQNIRLSIEHIQGREREIIYTMFADNQYVEFPIDPFRVKRFLGKITLIRPAEDAGDYHVHLNQLQRELPPYLYCDHTTTAMLSICSEHRRWITEIIMISDIPLLWRWAALHHLDSSETPVMSGYFSDRPDDYLAACFVIFVDTCSKGMPRHTFVPVDTLWNHKNIVAWTLKVLTTGVREKISKMISDNSEMSLLGYGFWSRDHFLLNSDDDPMTKCFQKIHDLFWGELDRQWIVSVCQGKAFEFVDTWEGPDPDVKDEIKTFLSNRVLSLVRCRWGLSPRPSPVLTVSRNNFPLPTSTREALTRVQRTGEIRMRPDWIQLLKRRLGDSGSQFCVVNTFAASMSSQQELKDALLKTCSEERMERLRIHGKPPREIFFLEENPQWVAVLDFNYMEVGVFYPRRPPAGTPQVTKWMKQRCGGNTWEGVTFDHLLDEYSDRHLAIPCDTAFFLALFIQLMITINNRQPLKNVFAHMKLLDDIGDLEYTTLLVQYAKYIEGVII